MEIYRFTARVAERWPNQIHVVPDDEDGFLAYRDRAELRFNPFWHGPEIYVTVGNRSLIERCGDADRVEYSVTRRGS